MTDPAGENTTQLLHRLTGYEPGREWDESNPDPRIVQGFTANDLDHRPRFYKLYRADLSRLALPRQLPVAPAATADVLAGAIPPTPDALDLPGLARLLYLSAGVTRISSRNGSEFLFRAAGSAGGRFPLELYVAIPAGTTLPAGLYWYDPREHALVEIGPPPTGQTPTLIVTGLPWRTGWRYAERGFRHIYWDAGTMLAQMLALAESTGLPAQLFTRFPDRSVTGLVGADGVAEFAVAVVTLGRGAPAITAAGPAVSSEYDPDAIEFPLVSAAQRAGEADALGRPWPAGPAVSATVASTPALDEVILRRGSMRRMQPTVELPASILRSSLTVALRGITVPHWVAVHAVAGIAPGLYRWPDLDRPVRAGSLRAELYGVALEQGLARDASFVVIAAADLTGVDDHGYRDLQLAAGLVEGRLHLMAYALGAAASGMTFRDSDIAGLLGEDLAGLLWTCVGVPEYRSKPGGQPGAAAEITMVRPR